MATRVAVHAPCCHTSSCLSPSAEVGPQRVQARSHQRTTSSPQRGFFGSCSAFAAPRHRRSRQAPGRAPLQVHASVFGVGAPEALVVGVVALVVFGPRGLAEAVKSLGATLKTFQPTIREVLGVTQDLRNTLEEQIGLDDIRRELRGGSATPSWSQTNQFKPTDSYQWDKERAESSNGASSSSSNGSSGTADSTSPSSNAESAQASSRPHAADEDLDSMRKQSASAAWGGQTPDKPPQQQQASNSGSAGGEVLSGLTLEDLEAELKRRKASKQEVQKT